MNAARSLAICFALWFSVGVACADAPKSDTPKSDTPKSDAPQADLVKPADLFLVDKVAKRRVYVLHSGLHTVLSEGMKNLAADTLKAGLLKRGVPERDLVVLENPFPTASWKSIIPYEALALFHDLMDPATAPSQEAYQRLHKALQAHGVNDKDDVVWVGHSAGGQVGVTMAYLARNLWRYPELARCTSSYAFDMVVTLGTPLGTSQLPPEVKLRVYYSPQDKIVRWAPKVGPWLFPLGYKTRLTRIPLELAGNIKVRFFNEIEHPSWDVDERVLDRIVNETRSNFRPIWHSNLSVPRPGLSLSQFLCSVLDEQCHISVEDPPGAK